RANFGVPVAINAIFSSVLNRILKILIARDRPDILRLVAETGYGFPSGHAMNNAALYAIVIFIAFRQTKNKKVRIPVLLCGIMATFLIGVSRIYLGVHNAGDILAGWIMGVTAALLADTAYTALLQKTTHT
ncbi:MAG: phosphatase PAP2 family protein, partial [Oscillospiraceae bacterium]|nr:phosphatase PAP2 family protein [Oscillospiraceae bacterium]